MRIQKKTLAETNQEEYEVCVMCGALTDVPKSMSVDLRTGYYCGAGQLCRRCADAMVTEERAAMRNGFLYEFPLYVERYGHAVTED